MIAASYEKTWVTVAAYGAATEPESAGARLTLLPVLGGGTFGASASLDF